MKQMQILYPYKRNSLFYTPSTNHKGTCDIARRASVGANL